MNKNYFEMSIPLLCLSSHNRCVPMSERRGLSMNNRNNGRYGKGWGGMKAVTIDVDRVYRQLSARISERIRWQEEFNRLFNLVNRDHADRSAAIGEMSRRIGESTHAINQLISELCRYPGRHRAMNLAERYLEQEISRAKKVTAKWQRTIHEVESGRRTLLSANGTVHRDTRRSRDYVSNKQRQTAKLVKWLSYVRSHRL